MDDISYHRSWMIRNIIHRLERRSSRIVVQSSGGLFHPGRWLVNTEFDVHVYTPSSRHAQTWNSLYQSESHLHPIQVHNIAVSGHRVLPMAAVYMHPLCLGTGSAFTPQAATQPAVCGNAVRDLRPTGALHSVARPMMWHAGQQKARPPRCPPAGLFLRHHRSSPTTTIADHQLTSHQHRTLACAAPPQRQQMDLSVLGRQVTGVPAVRLLADAPSR